jgi:hypothetical protein
LTLDDSIRQSLEAVTFQFQKNPFDFLYESDLHCFLYAELFKRLSNDRTHIQCGYNEPPSYVNRDYIETTIVKSEYPSVVKYDIALLDGDSPIHFDAQTSRTEGWKNDPLWIQPLQAIIELKFLQPGDDRADKKNAFRSDIERLLAYKKNHRTAKPFLGICILFVSDYRVDGSAFVFGHESPFDSIVEGVWGIVVTPSKRMTFTAL